MPSPFFEVIIHEVEPSPALTGLCAGYEAGEWRHQHLAKTLMRALPEFCLRYSEYQGMNHENAMKYIAEAALSIYQTDKFSKRGEFGELLLHVVLRQVFDTIPAVSKIYFKDAPNDTVKGFDAVHVIATDVGLELWLGEVKFYIDIGAAIADVTEELGKHLEADYLKNEFMLVGRKIDDHWPHAGRLKMLLDPDTSLDKVFETVCIPVLLTYNSDTTKKHSKLTDEYRKELESELREFHSKFVKKNPLKNLKVRLVLFPLNTKEILVKNLHAILEAAKCL